MMGLCGERIGRLWDFGLCEKLSFPMKFKDKLQMILLGLQTGSEKILKENQT